MTDPNEIVTKLVLAALRDEPALITCAASPDEGRVPNADTFMEQVVGDGASWTLARYRNQWYLNAYKVSRSELLKFFQEGLTALTAEVDV